MSFSHRARHFTNAGITNFYYSFVFLPPEKRRAIEAVYAYARRCDDAADSQLTADRAAQEIARCREDLERCYRDSVGAGLSPELAALAEAIHRFGICREHFEELLRGVEMDLRLVRYRTFEDLSLYCYRVASTIGLIAIEIFGYQNLSAREYAKHQGMALQLVNILRDLGTDASRGRVYLPQEDLERFGVRAESFQEGKPSGRFRELMEFESNRTRHYFKLARQALAPVDRRSMVAAEIMGAIYWKLLKRIERRGYDVFNGRVRLSKLAKLWVAFKVFCGAEWQN